MPLITAFCHMMFSNLYNPQNGSIENRTVHDANMLAAIRNRLYLCNAFEIQVQNLEY